MCRGYISTASALRADSIRAVVAYAAFRILLLALTIPVAILFAILWLCAGVPGILLLSLGHGPRRRLLILGTRVEPSRAATRVIWSTWIRLPLSRAGDLRARPSIGFGILMALALAPLSSAIFVGGCVGRYVGCD